MTIDIIMGLIIFNSIVSGILISACAGICIAELVAKICGKKRNGTYTSIHSSDEGRN